eukprot:CAMPEP_0178921910 /NCGR_PEP_ID=MMETSP0786-20121207/15833_1 /TAXON_ID=186022 /ORGANISM="Thalassionema frauenfeldii, Strain CCMP 1798" /LENGTH=55 /DNA_ID=CAMNT_0020596161 /DNA_START=108 /DNA_END=272 /DNA_ORIENTATION=-
MNTIHANPMDLDFFDNAVLFQEQKAHLEEAQQTRQIRANKNDIDFDESKVKIVGF